LPKNSDAFSQQLRRRRKALGLSQRALAARANCAQITVQKIEAGERSPTAGLAVALVRALGLDPAAAQSLLAQLPNSPHDAATLSESDRALRYLSLAESVFAEYDTPQKRQADDVLRAELPMLFATANWLLRNDVQRAQLLLGKLQRFWGAENLYHDVKPLLRQSLLLDATPGIARAVALYAHARIAFDGSDYDLAHAFGSEAFALSKQFGSALLAGLVALELGRGATHHQRNLSMSRAYLAEAQAFLAAHGDRFFLAHGMSLSAALLASQGSTALDEARPLAEHAVTLALAQDSALLKGVAIAALANVLVECEAWSLAIEKCDAAHDWFLKSTNPALRVWSLTSAGYCLMRAGHFGEATKKRKQALTIFQDTQNAFGTCLMMHGLGQLAKLQGDLVEARRLFLTSLRASLASNDDGIMCAAAVDLAGFALADGDPLRAVDLLAFADQRIAAGRIRLWGEVKANHDDFLQQARTQLGAAVFDARYAQTPDIRLLLQ
jgi:transcriptional regulator with XRE-family HTH domain